MIRLEGIGSYSGISAEVFNSRGTENFFDIFLSPMAVNTAAYIREYEPSLPGETRLQQTNHWIIAAAGRLKLKKVKQVE